MTEETSPAPARPRKLKAQYEVVGDRLRVSWRRRDWPAAILILLFLAPWTVACGLLAFAFVVDPNLILLLAALPFWSLWCFLVATLVEMLAAYDEIDVNAMGLQRRSRTVFPAQRKIELWELRSCNVVSWQKFADEYGLREYGIELQTWGRPLRVLEGLPEAELRWLANQFTEVVDNLRRAAPASAMQQALAEFADDQFPQRLARFDSALLPPSDCEWTSSKAVGVLEFANRGRRNWELVLGLVLVASIWNGFFGMFMALTCRAHDTWMRVVMILLLLPFLAIGLLMLIALASTMAEPLRRNTWRFTPLGIEAEVRWQTVGRRWFYACDRLDRIELDKANSTRRGCLRNMLQPTKSLDPDECPYRLSFIGRDNVKVCEIISLTEGEARWIADQVLRNRPEWFRA